MVILSGMLAVRSRAGAVLARRHSGARQRVRPEVAGSMNPASRMHNHETRFLKGRAATESQGSSDSGFLAYARPRNDRLIAQEQPRPAVWAWPASSAPPPSPRAGLSGRLGVSRLRRRLGVGRFAWRLARSAWRRWTSYLPASRVPPDRRWSVPPSLYDAWFSFCVAGSAAMSEERVASCDGERVGPV